MYYDHPDAAAAYEVPNQFMFGTQLLVAPITAPADPETRMGTVDAWLPDGEWVDVFTGLRYRGGRTIALHRDLDSIPVLAPAGAILPLASGDLGIGNPDALELRVYAGADGEFTLAEENDDERWAFTRITLRGDELRFHPVDGERASVPAQRSYDVVLCGFTEVTGVEVDGTEQPVEPGPVPGSVHVEVDVAAGDGRVLRLTGDLGAAGNRDVGERVFALLDAAQIELATKEAVHRVVTEHDPARAVAALTALDLPRPLFTAVVELLLA
jgi:Glycosyl hydrolases family 31